MPPHVANRAATAIESRSRILVVDDDADLRIILEGVLVGAGMDVIAAGHGRQALHLLFEKRPDAVVLDLGLPDIDGVEVLSRLRDMTDVPVVVLTARGMERQKIEAFGRGADDYVTKPFSNAELVARLQAVLRRAHAGSEQSEMLTDGPLSIDLLGKEVRLSGGQIQLSPIDWNLLVALVRHKGQVLSLDQLLAYAWRDTYGVNPARVKFATLRLRRRMGWQDPATSPIEAVRGFGYRYRGLPATLSASASDGTELARDT